MLNKKSTHKHNKLLTRRVNYYSDGGINWKLKSSTDPSVSQTGFKGVLNSGKLGDIGSSIGQLGGSVISGGLESGVGKVFSGLSSAASAIPGPWGAVASAGLGLIGGLSNRMFGSKMDERNIATIERDIGAAQNLISNATDYDSLSEVIGKTSAMSDFSDSYIGRDGWFSNKAKEKAGDLRDRMRVANARQDLSIINNAENIASSNMANLAANYAAFGGPLDMGPLEYDLQRRFLSTKELEAIGQNKNTTALPNSFNTFEPSMFAEGGKIYIKPENRGKFTALKERTGKSATWFKKHGTPAQKKMATFALNARKWKHAEGGPMHTHGGIFSNGLLEINNGDTHEANPFEGVPMGVDQEGTPNLVEEGETIFNDYVFSNRLKVPKAVREKYKLRGKKGITFADASKKLAKESEERPNDPISMRGLEALLSDLAMEQEELKAKNSRRQYANGGRLFKDGGTRPRNPYGYVKGYNNGWFDSEGKYTQEYLNKVNSMTPEQLARAFNEQYAFYNNPENEGSDRWNAIDKFYASNPQFRTDNISLSADEVEWAKRGAQDYKPGFMHQFFMDAETPDQTPERLTANRYWIRGENGPTQMEVTPWEGLNEQGQTFAEAHPELSFYGKQERPYDEASNTTYTDYYYDPVEQAAPAPETPAQDYKKLPTWLRYAPAVGLGISAITDAVGWTNKPDYSNADAVLAATRENAVDQVRFNPIGNYLEYSPFDRDYYINKLNAQSGATRRAIAQNAGLNRGAGMAALLAADYNAQNQLGDLARQAEEYNLAQRQKVEEFNRGTNMANSQGFLQADMANQRARSELQGLNLKASLAAAEMRERARLASDQAKSANLSGFIQSLGDIGRENMAWNWRNFGLATGSFGNVGDTEEYLLSNTSRRSPRPEGQSKSRGGKIKRKRKGLTY